MHHKGKFWNTIHLGKKKTSKSTAHPKPFPRAGAQTQNYGSITSAKGKIHRKPSAQGTRCALEQPQPSPAEAGGTPSAPASLSQCHARVSFVRPQRNYEDLHGNFLPVPRLLSARCKFKAALPAAQGVGTELVAVS